MEQQQNRHFSLRFLVSYNTYSFSSASKCKNMGHSGHRGVLTHSHILPSLHFLFSNFIKYCYLRFLDFGIIILVGSVSPYCSNSSCHVFASINLASLTSPNLSPYGKTSPWYSHPSTPQSKFPFLTGVSIFCSQRSISPSGNTHAIAAWDIIMLAFLPSASLTKRPAPHSLDSRWLSIFLLDVTPADSGKRNISSYV